MSVLFHFVLYYFVSFVCLLNGWGRRGGREGGCTLGHHSVSLSCGSAFLISPSPHFFVICLARVSFEPLSDWLVGALFLSLSPVANVFLCLPLLFPSSPFSLPQLTRSTLTLIHNHVPHTSKRRPNKNSVLLTDDCVQHIFHPPKCLILEGRFSAELFSVPQC